MGNYILRRLLLMIPTLLGITVVTFAMIRLAPGDPITLSTGGDPSMTAEGSGAEMARAEMVRRAKIELGILDEDGQEIPLPLQYWNWLSRTARLDFGRSFKDKKPVIEKIGESLPITLLLSFSTILLTYLISVPIGVFSAVRRNTVADHSVSTVLFVLWAVPSFVAGTLMILTLGRAGWLPFVGLHSPGHERLGYLPWLKDHALHILMPLACLTYAHFAALSRFVRTGLLENLKLDYVRTALAKGVSPRVAILKHALRNSLIPVITIMASILPALIGGSIIVEYIFTINGMGYLMWQSILSRDYPVIMAITTFSAVLTLLGILLSDILYCLVDPRISLE